MLMLIHTIKPQICGNTQLTIMNEKQDLFKSKLNQIKTLT